jgi:hypothetical protein
MGSLLVEMAYLTETKCFILMGSFAAAGRFLHPYQSPASALRFRRFGYRMAISGFTILSYLPRFVGFFRASKA